MEFMEGVAFGLRVAAAVAAGVVILAIAGALINRLAADEERPGSR